MPRRHNCIDMTQLAQFDYDLPSALIAQTPRARRTDSLLLHRQCDGGEFCIRRFADIAALLSPGDLLVANDTRVLPARIIAAKPSGGKVEILLERIIDHATALVQLGANKPVREQQPLLVGAHRLTVGGRQGRFFRIQSACGTDMRALFARCGSMPLPPYVKRPADDDDLHRYQTVYARHDGAVAAPTAGLHFDRALIERLTAAGIEWGALTLHIGAGTFTPVNSADITQHVMHREKIHIGERLVEQISATRRRGGRVIAVGTTVVRALESAVVDGALRAAEMETGLFIRPGFRFHVVDSLITNFHLPKSTLLMLVAAFAGGEHTRAYYRHAIQNKLRFYSYGDAMMVDKSG